MKMQILIPTFSAKRKTLGNGKGDKKTSVKRQLEHCIEESQRINTRGFRARKRTGREEKRVELGVAKNRVELPVA